MRPVIGVTLDWQEKGTYSKRPHYALRENYFKIIYKAGGIPLALPQIGEAVDELISKVDGLMIPGGGFASPPDWYVESEDNCPYEPSPRLGFDLAIIEKAFKLDKPILGICAGMQLMGGVKGCKMTPNIHKYLGTKIDHLNEKPAEEFAHKVKVKKGSLLAKITKSQEFDVNTAHQEAIVKAPDNVVINAVAPDGTIEGIEFPEYRFALGVQWHPEFFDQAKDPNFLIFKALIAEAKKRK